MRTVLIGSPRCYGFAFDRAKAVEHAVVRGSARIQVEYLEGALVMNLEELVEQFALNVVAQTEAIWRGDAKTENKYTRKYGAAVDKLLRIDVRVMAAAHLLRYRMAEAKVVLEEAASGEGLIPFGAQLALKRLIGRHLGPWPGITRGCLALVLLA